MSELVIPKPTLWFPRYASPRNPGGIVPPSPPSEQRAKWRREILRAVRSYTGRFPEGWHFSRIGTPGSMSGGMQSLTGVETGLYGSNLITSLQDAAFFYKMGEASGNRVDSTAGANDVAPSFTGGGSELGNTAGKLGNAAVLWDGATHGEYFSHASATAYNMSGASQNYTFYCWFYALDTTSGAMIAKGDGNFNTLEYWVRWKSGADQWPRITIGYASGASDTLGWGATITTTAWHMLEGGVDASASPNKIFLNIDNGTRVTLNLANNGGTNYGATFPFYIGARDGVSAGSPNDFFHSYMEQVGGWKRLWTPTERTSVWNSGNGALIF